MPETLKRVGRYEVVREIGRGGMATVYLARQLDLDRSAALKQLHALHTSDKSLAQRFLHESRVAGSLTHPSIVTVYDYLEADGTPYIAMEYLERGSFRPYVADLSLAQVGAVLEALLAGLAHAERQGIVHRDLKPENLMVTGDGKVKIADFGIAKATTEIEAPAFKTETGMTVGTPGYMAPEQAMAQTLGPWTDLYSLGCIAYEMVVGSIPFADTQAPMALVLRHINERVPSAADVDPRVPPMISDWLDRLLEREAARRTQSAAAAWEELEEGLIDLLGPRWRRGGRLPDAPPPHTGEPARSRLVPLVPGPYTPPPPQAVPGPSTPPPSDTAPPEGNFVTYRAEPVPVPVEDEPPPEPEPPPADVPPAPAAPPSAAPPPAAPVEPPAAEAPPAAIEPPRDLPPTVAPRPSREPPDEPSRRSPRGRRGIAIAIAIGLLGVGALVVVTGLLGSSPSEPPSQRSATAGPALTAGPLRAEAPAGWQPVGEELNVPGLQLRDQAAMAPGGREQSGVALLGLAGKDANTASLLPAAFLDALGLRPGIVPAGSEVTLGPDRIEAYRYDQLVPPRLGRSVTVFASPTSAGVATLACVAPRTSAAGFAEQCDQIAETLTAGDLAEYPVGPSEDYAAAVDAMFDDVNSALNRGVSTMRRADTPRAQGGAARTMATAVRRSRERLGRLELSPADRGANATLIGALRKLERSLGSVSDAARAERRAAYGSAATRAESAQGGLAEALTEIAAAGYAPLITARFHPRELPAMKRVASPDTQSDPAPDDRAEPEQTPSGPDVTPQPTPNPTPAPTPLPTPEPRPTPEPGEPPITGP